MFWRGGEVAPFGEWLWEWLSLHLLHWYVIVLCAFFNTGKSEGTNLKMCVWWLCMYVLLYSVGIDFVDLTGGRCTDMRSFDVCICLWQEFDCPEVTLCCWQDVTILVDTSVIRMILLVGYHPEILLHYSKVTCVVFQRVLSVARWRQSCNPRFYQSWKSWPLVPATSSNWEWATATSSSHTSAGCTCHTCRLNLPHLSRLNLPHLSRLNLSHLQAEPVTSAGWTRHTPTSAFVALASRQQNLSSRTARLTEMSDIKAAGQRKWRYRSSCGDRQQHWERLQTLLLVLDWLFEHDPSECRSTTCLDTHGSTPYITSAKHVHSGSRQPLHSCVNMLTDHMASGNGDSKGRSPWKNAHKLRLLSIFIMEY